MKRVRCIKEVYFFMTAKKDYDVVEYNSKENTIKVYNDMGMLANLKLSITLIEDGEEMPVFQNVTNEYRNEIIDNILS